MSRRLSLALCLLLSIFNTDCIKFFGVCPETPPSHQLTDQLEPLNLIRAIPFEGYNYTNMFTFPEKNSTHFPELNLSIKKFDSQEKYNLSIFHNYLDPKVELESVIEYCNGSVCLHPTVYAKGRTDRVELKCFSSTVQKREAKIWLDGEFVIIWSCVEAYWGDQAVMLLTNNFWPFAIDLNGPTFKNFMKNLRNVSKKYLPPELIESIDWAPTVGMFGHPTGIEFKCPEEVKEASQFAFFVLGGYLLLIGCIAVLFFGNSEKGCNMRVKRSNQVSPYVIE